MVNVTSLRKVNVLKFVGTLKKVKFKIAHAMTAFHKFKNILCYISLSTGGEKNILGAIKKLVSCMS